MMQRSATWRSLWRPALRHIQHGHPPPFAPMLSTNAMAIEHASHLWRFHLHHECCLQDTDCIVEFGGGFGSMCRMAHALGFRGQFFRRCWLYSATTSACMVSLQMSPVMPLYGFVRICTASWLVWVEQRLNVCR